MLAWGAWDEEQEQTPEEQWAVYDNVYAGRNDNRSTSDAFQARRQSIAARRANLPPEFAARRKSRRSVHLMKKTSSYPRLITLIRLIFIQMPFPLIFMLGFMAGPGYLGYMYAVEFLDQTLVLELSLDAFTAPNHIVSQRADGFSAASKHCLVDACLTEICEQEASAGARRRRQLAVDQGLLHSDFFYHNATKGMADPSFGLQPGKRKVEFAGGQIVLNEDDWVGRPRERTRRHERRASSFDISIVFVARPGENMLSPQNVLFMQSVERKLYATCFLRSGTICDTPQTSMVYFYPPVGYLDTDDTPPTLTQEQIVATVQYASQTDITNPTVQQYIQAGYPPPIGDQALVFGGPEMTPANDYATETIACKYYINEEGTPEAYTFWGDFISSQATDEVTIVFTNQAISDQELQNMLSGDLLLAAYSFAAVGGYALLHTGSVFLTVFGLLNMVLSLPLALFIFRGVLKNTNNLTVLTIMSIFITIGISVDDVFVFIDTFKMPEDVDLTARMVYTITHAGRATFFTSLTSASAFAANAVSEIPALYDFGVLTSLIVAANYLLCITITPCMLSLWWRFVMPMERWLFRCLSRPCRKKRPKQLRDEGKDEVFQMDQIRRPSTIDVHSVKFDVVLADDEWGNPGGSRSRTKTNIVVTNEPIFDDVKTVEYEKGVLHKFLAGVWAPFILKLRWLIVLAIWTTLGVCIWQAMSIAPATSPPQFFPAGSNMANVQDMTERYPGWGTGGIGSLPDSTDIVVLEDGDCILEGFDCSANNGRPFAATYSSADCVGGQGFCATTDCCVSPTCAEDGTVSAANCQSLNREQVGNYNTKTCTQPDGTCSTDDCCGGVTCARTSFDCAAVSRSQAPNYATRECASTSACLADECCGGTTCALSAYSCGGNDQRDDYSTATCAESACTVAECCKGQTCQASVCDNASPPRTHRPNLGSITCSTEQLNCQEDECCLGTTCDATPGAFDCAAAGKADAGDYAGKQCAGATCTETECCGATTCQLSSFDCSATQQVPSESFASAQCAGATCTPSECCKPGTTCQLSAFDCGALDDSDTFSTDECASSPCQTAECCKPAQPVKNCQDENFDCSAQTPHPRRQHPQYSSKDCAALLSSGDPCLADECCLGTTCQDHGYACGSESPARQPLANYATATCALAACIADECCGGTTCVDDGSVNCVGESPPRSNRDDFGTQTCSSAAACTADECCKGTTCAASSYNCAAAGRVDSATYGSDTCAGGSCTSDECCGVYTCQLSNYDCSAEAKLDSDSYATAQCTTSSCDAATCCKPRIKCNIDCSSVGANSADYATTDCATETCTTNECCVASCQTSGFDCANNSPSYDPATDYPTATCASTSCTAEECCATTLGDFDACQGEECNQRSVESSPNKWIDIVVGFGGDYVTRTPPPGTFVQSSDDWFPIFDLEFNKDGDQTTTPFQAELKALCEGLVSNANLTTPGQTCDDIDIGKDIKKYGFKYADCAEENPADKQLAWISFQIKGVFTENSGSSQVRAAIAAWDEYFADFANSSTISGIYHTAEQYKLATYESLAVTGAIWSVCISFALCFFCVFIFTGASLTLCTITMISLFTMTALVVSSFVWLGWTLGGVEAIALSVLVGSSVDYLIHIIEGYLHSDPGDAPKEGNIRCFRLGRALASVGIPIISSGLTTMAAGIVLIFCQIQLLSKFGIIMALNTGVAITITMTGTAAFLATAGPKTYTGSTKRMLLAVVVSGALAGIAVGVVYGLARGGTAIYGPAGVPIFPVAG